MIVKDTKEEEDYVVIMWEGIRMAKNGAKKEVYLAKQAKGGLEQPKVRSISETSNIKVELSAVMKGAERAEHERHEMANIQSQVD